MLQLNTLKKEIVFCALIQEDTEHHDLLDYMFDEEVEKTQNYINTHYERIKFIEAFSIGIPGDEPNKIQKILELVKTSHPLTQLVKAQDLTKSEVAKIKERIQENTKKNEAYLKEQDDNGEGIYPCEINQGLICFKEREDSILLPLHNLDLNHVDKEATIPPVRKIIELAQLAGGKQKKSEVAKNFITIKKITKDLITGGYNKQGTGWLLGRLLRAELT